jgi:hypothetical protein
VIVVLCPPCPTVREAIDYLDGHGCRSFYLWRGPDRLVRGHGLKATNTHAQPRRD